MPGGGARTLKDWLPLERRHGQPLRPRVHTLCCMDLACAPLRHVASRGRHLRHRAHASFPEQPAANASAFCRVRASRRAARLAEPTPEASRRRRQRPLPVAVALDGREEAPLMLLRHILAADPPAVPQQRHTRAREVGGGAGARPSLGGARGTGGAGGRAVEGCERGGAVGGEGAEGWGFESLRSHQHLSSLRSMCMQ